MDGNGWGGDRDARRDSDPNLKVSKTTPSHRSCSFLTPHPLGSCGGGGQVIPQNPTHPPVVRTQPPTGPLWLGFAFSAPNPSPASRCRTPHSAITTASYAPPNHFFPSTPAALSVGVPETKPKRLNLGLLAPHPPPSLAQANRALQCCCYLVRTTLPLCPTIPCRLFSLAHPKPSPNGSVLSFGPKPLPPLAPSNGHCNHRNLYIYHSSLLPPIARRRCFHQRSRNRAPAALFPVLSPKPAAPACATNRNTPPPPLPCKNHPTTPFHRPPQPFPMAHP
jgi:hypothetical protein